MAAPTTRKTPPKPPDPAVQRIAAELGESESQPLAHITRIVATLGEERALGLLQQASEIEQRGGMMLPDGSRRRTPGGVFFRLVRDHTSPQERARIWAWARGPKPRTIEHARGMER